MIALLIIAGVVAVAGFFIVWTTNALRSQLIGAGLFTAGLVLVLEALIAIAR
jgi:hypothetical protein